MKRSATNRVRSAAFCGGEDLRAALILPRSALIPVTELLRLSCP